jgi:hypothetical protein
MTATTVTVSGVKVRLKGIDAPEKRQFCLDSKSQPWACGEAALAELTKKAGDRPWTCHVSGRYSFDRLLGSCRVDDEDIQRWMVRSGLALSAYSHVYDADEKTAREERAGLWSGAFIRPEDWRHRNKSTSVLGADSVPVDAQKILLRPEPRGNISAKIPEQTPTETTTPSPRPIAAPPTAPISATTTHTPTAPISATTTHTPASTPSGISATTTHTPTSTPSGATIHVHGYTRKDGTVVAPYERHAPSPRKH